MTLLHAPWVLEKTIQEILGHTQITFTMDTYADHVPAHHLYAMDAMERYLRSSLESIRGELSSVCPRNPVPLRLKGPQTTK